MVLMGLHMLGTRGMLLYLECAGFVVPVLRCSLGTQSHWPPCDVCVLLDPQKLHEEQRVTLQPPGSV